MTKQERMEMIERCAKGLFEQAMSDRKNFGRRGQLTSTEDVLERYWDKPWEKVGKPIRYGWRRKAKEVLFGD